MEPKTSNIQRRTAPTFHIQALYMLNAWPCQVLIKKAVWLSNSQLGRFAATFQVSITFCSSVLHRVFQRRGPWEDSYEGCDGCGMDGGFLGDSWDDSKSTEIFHITKGWIQMKGIYHTNYEQLNNQQLVK